jgi:hypothetical protein
MSTMNFEFYMKRGQVHLDDIEEESDLASINKVIALIKDEKFEDAIEALPAMYFEWIPMNGDGDCSEVFESDEDFQIPLTQENSTVRVGYENESLILTISVTFPMGVKDDVDAEQLAEWLDDNSMYACGYVGAGWSYDGDDGCTLHVIES